MPADAELKVALSAEQARVLRAVLVKLVPDRPVEAELERRLADLAERLHFVLREARKVLPDDAGGEGGCDMLLLLYCAEARGHEVTVTSLGSSMGLPHATAARRMSALTKTGLIELRRDQADRRRRFVALTRPALEIITSWLELVEGNSRLATAGA